MATKYKNIVGTGFDPYVKKQLEVRESYLTPVSNEGEILNVKGPLRTMNKKLEESKNGATERN